MAPSNPKAAELLPKAFAARENGNHYDGFKVGCVGYGANGEIYMGANFKPVQNMEPTCAEEQVMLQAAEDDVVLDGMVVVGQPRPEDTTPTLHCCGERCQPRMLARYKQGRVIKADTHLTFVNSITNAVEEFTFKSLLEAHGKSLND